MRTMTQKYAIREVSPRWPSLVRERAMEGWEPRRDPCLDAAHASPRFATDPEDDLFLLGERCAEAYMQADALHYQAMRLLAEFDRREGWQDTGFSSTAEWLAWRIGIRPGAARERLRTALALEQLPETSEAMRNGEVSFTKVRALTRVATPDNETTLLDFARAGSAANLERMVRGWKKLDRKSELTAEQIRHRSRRFSAFVDDDGMVVVRGRLDPEVGAVFMRAVEAAHDALYRGGAEGSESPARGSGKGCGGRRGVERRSGQVCCGNEWRSEREAEADAELGETTPEQRRADAVGLIAERALAAGFGGRHGRGCECGCGCGCGGHTEEGDKAGAGDEGANGADEGWGRNANEGDIGTAPISGSRAERYQVMLHVDGGTLREEGEVGQSELEDGTRVSAETSRRVACDSGLVTITHGADGRVLGAGRRKRTVSPSLRRALEARDRGCRFPGCGLRFTDAHHVKHWADGGETSLRNLVLLCRRHHRAVHEGGVRVCIDANQQVVFFTPKGKTLFGAPPVQPRSVDGGAAVARSRVVGIEPAHRSGAARWKRDRDMPWAVEARAWEALDPG
jgi:hypothetical protein